MHPGVPQGDVHSLTLYLVMHNGWAGYLYRFGRAVFSAVFLTSAAVQYDIKIKD